MPNKDNIVKQHAKAAEEAVSGITWPSCPISDRFFKEIDLAATTEQLAESQESIFLLRKQLKALRPQKEFMWSPNNNERNQKMSASLNKNQLPVV
ncbi:filament-like plant protein 6 [Actinidia eriantha]|uniref:filament-like plant protein 6 n=1 Tax=Actinidia eriantha TaxID=165200 RepID=UPI00258C4812|nr:filament-like plant protein 6 [Actinidia eriantha]